MFGKTEILISCEMFLCRRALGNSGTAHQGNHSALPLAGNVVGWAIMKAPLFLCALAGISVVAIAQTPPAQPQPASGNQQRVNDAENQTKFWECSTTGGSYTTTLGNITSVSIHEFNVTGGRVTECTIDTNGNTVARFYFMEAMKAGSALSVTNVVKERIEQVGDSVAERTGTAKVWQQVQKDYPIATHAHTVEYRLQNKSDVQAIHGSALGAWKKGIGRTIRIIDN